MLDSHVRPSCGSYVLLYKIVRHWIRDNGHGFNAIAVGDVVVEVGIPSIPGRLSESSCSYPVGYLVVSVRVLDVIFDANFCVCPPVLSNVFLVYCSNSPTELLPRTPMPLSIDRTTQQPIFSFYRPFYPRAINTPCRATYDTLDLLFNIYFETEI